MPKGSVEKTLAKLGITGKLQGLIMIIIGILIFLFPDLLAILVAAFLIIVGIMRLIE